MASILETFQRMSWEPACFLGAVKCVIIGFSRPWTVHPQHSSVILTAVLFYLRRIWFPFLTISVIFILLEGSSNTPLDSLVNGFS